MPIVEEYVEETTGEDNPNFIYDEEVVVREAEEEELIDESLEIPSSPVSKMSKSEIFETVEEVDEPIIKPKMVKEKKKRPPMSEEHKEKLKLAREKALMTRRKNSQEKKDMKELEKKVKEKKKQNLQKFVEEDEPLRQTMRKEEPIDVEKAVLDGIMKYEALRKDRKRLKGEQQKVKDDEDKVKEQINRAVQRNDDVFYGDKDYFKPAII